MMDFYEEELFFNSNIEKEKGIFDSDIIGLEKEPELLGVKTRIGNCPIVYNLQQLFDLAQKKLPPELEVQFQTNNIYLITHAVGVIRTKGSSQVVELQYNAEITSSLESKTIDLFPKTKVIDRFAIESGLSGTVMAAGNFSAEVPDELKNSLSGTSLTLGGELNLELSTNTKFVGKINYNIKLPIVQSSGIASNKCTWVLKPDENPLLGDQLLIQTIAVPKKVKTLNYSVKALVKIRQGWLHKTQEKETTTQIINIELT
ncbi:MULTISPECIES: hypothetical protein [unclassified Sphingobacterium]|uniref:hypothetical protein n=1 Tax=unclassified Sphingobacterium TaxID=2609468 RepID=UPI0025F83322|nr:MULTISPECIES: hypothetical protein [unclassified Sphingobacterium]